MNKNTKTPLLKDEDLQKMYLQAQGSLQVMMAVGLSTGLRWHDLLNLRWADFKATSGIITFISRKKPGTKHEVPLAVPVQELLAGHRTQCPSCEYIFPKEREQFATGDLQEINWVVKFLRAVRQQYITHFPTIPAIVQRLLGRSSKSVISKNTSSDGQPKP